MLYPFTPTGSRADASVREALPSLPELRPSATAIDRMRPLLAAAAELDPANETEWRHLRDIAAHHVAMLIEAGRLPVHLAIAPDEPPVVVVRSLAAAWRHVTDAPSRR